MDREKATRQFQRRRDMRMFTAIKIDKPA